MKPQQSTYTAGGFSPVTNNAGRAPITFLGLIRSFIIKFLSAIPLSMRIFLRNRIGSMTFSLAGLLFAALWVRFILDGTYQMHELSPPETFWYEQFNKGSGVKYVFAVTLWYIGMFFVQFIGVIARFIPTGIADGIDSSLDAYIYFPFFLSLTVLGIGIWRYVQIKRMHAKREIFDPMSRGDSLLFEPLLNLIKPRNRPLTLMYLEVAFLLLLATIFHRWSFINPEWLDYAVFVALGAVGLAVEEWIAQQQLQRELEIRFANEFKANNLQEIYRQYKREAVDQTATVSFVGFTHYSASHQTPLQPRPLQSEKWRQWRIYLEGLHLKKLAVAGVILIGALIIVNALISPQRPITEVVEMVGIIQAESLTLREEPRRSAESFAILEKGQVVQIIACGIFERNTQREWCKILHNGQPGYSARIGNDETQYLWTETLASYDLTFFDTPFVDRVATEQGSTLNLRQTPHLNAEILARMPNEAEVTVLGREGAPRFLEVGDELIFGSWCRIRFQDIEGYCFSWYLTSCRIY